MLTPPPRHVVEHTDDGSPTVRDTLLDCTFHSRHGALAETQHVFIEAGLRYRLSRPNAAMISPYGKEGSGEVRILEVGFGSGLNVAATLASFPEAFIHFTTMERFPLGHEAQEAVVAHAPDSVRVHLADVLGCVWEIEHAITPSFTLRKIETDLLSFHIPLRFDVCYFDAFAPTDQPELWTIEVFQKLLGWANPDAVLVTYCSKGDVRRAMQAAGWNVMKLPGPKGKREMLRATKVI